MERKFEGISMADKKRKKRNRYIVPLAITAFLLLFLFGYADDWSRDFTENKAAISAEAEDTAMRPLFDGRSTAEMMEAVKRAASRIRTWEYIGHAKEGNTTLVLFVRTSRLFRFKDDIIILIDDLGDRRQVTGKSASRIGIGDLGQNPRNLRRLFAELRDVLEGAS
jgi:uncharacterized protein (DUF1499 family)